MLAAVCKKKSVAPPRKRMGSSNGTLGLVRGRRTRKRGEKKIIRNWVAEPVLKEEEVSTVSQNQQVGEEVCRYLKSWSKMSNPWRDVKNRGKSGQSIGAATEVQGMEDRAWRKEELRSLEEGLSRLKEERSERFLPKVLLDFSQEACPPPPTPPHHTTHTHTHTHHTHTPHTPHTHTHTHTHTPPHTHTTHTTHTHHTPHHTHTHTHHTHTTHTHHTHTTHTHTHTHTHTPHSHTTHTHTHTTFTHPNHNHKHHHHQAFRTESWQHQCADPVFLSVTLAASHDDGWRRRR